MEHIKIFLFVVLLGICTERLSAQQTINPVFKKLECVTYYVNNPGRNQTIHITKDLVVNETGLANLKSKYREGILDTTYRLNDDLIVSLNRIFDGNRKLTSFMIKDKFPEGTTYSGELQFLSYTDYKNITYYFIVVPPFMDQNFNYYLDQMVSDPSDSTFKNISIGNKIIESEISNYQLSSKYSMNAISPPTLIRILDSNK